MRKLSATGSIFNLPPQWMIIQCTNASYVRQGLEVTRTILLLHAIDSRTVQAVAALSAACKLIQESSPQHPLWVCACCSLATRVCWDTAHAAHRTVQEFFLFLSGLENTTGPLSLSHLPESLLLVLHWISSACIWASIESMFWKFTSCMIRVYVIAYCLRWFRIYGMTDVP